MPRPKKRRKAPLQEAEKAVISQQVEKTTPDTVEVSQNAEKSSKSSESSLDWGDWKTYIGVILGLGLAFAGGIAYERSQTTY